MTLLAGRPGVDRRPSTVVGGWLRELRLGWRNADVDLLVPRIAAVVFFVGGLLALVLDLLVEGAGSIPVDPQVALASSAFGAVAAVLPWRRWDTRIQLAIPSAALVLLACGGFRTDEAAPFLAVLPLPFVLVGFTQKPGMSSALAPFAAVALLIAARFELTPTLAATLAFVLPMSVLVGEAIAQAQTRRGRAEDRIDRLLHAVRVLAHVTDERVGAQLVASLAADLLDADAVAVLLADRPRSGRFRHRAWFGHPALADAAPLVIDRKTDPLLLRAGAVNFVADASEAPVLEASGAAGRVRSVAFVPLPGEGPQPLGVVLAMWGAGRRTLPAPARKAAELLSQDAGRMFQRLRVTAALAHDAETDPLTELANRRTFARALATLQPGDAVVLIDIDYFKSVNDRFGHEVGDRTLRTLARCLRKAARQVDCIARYGGEEFALVLPDAGAPGARAVLRRVRRSWESLSAITTFSSGVAVHETGGDAQETLRRADEALYAAKESGRNADMVAPASEIVLP